MANIRVTLVYGVYEIEVNGKSESLPYYNEKTGGIDFLPAIINKEGDKFWKKNERLHNPCGPAIVRTNGDYHFCIEGDCHNEFGIAAYDNKTTYYKYQGELHRIDGPAIIDNENNLKYYMYGVQVTKEDIDNNIKILKEAYYGENNKQAEINKKIQLNMHLSYLKRLGIECTFEDDLFETKVNGKLESLPYYNEETKSIDYMPAIYRVKNGYKSWYKNDKIHRENGPAYINGDYEYWYNNGVMHRENGPAYIEKEVKDGVTTILCAKYYLNGKEVTREDVMGKAEVKVYHEIVNETKKEEFPPSASNPNFVDWTPADHIRFILNNKDMSKEEQKECILLYINPDIKKIAQKEIIVFIVKAEGLDNSEKKQALLLFANN